MKRISIAAAGLLLATATLLAYQAGIASGAVPPPGQIRNTEACVSSPADTVSYAGPSASNNLAAAGITGLLAVAYSNGNGASLLFFTSDGVAQKRNASPLGWEHFSGGRARYGNIIVAWDPPPTATERAAVVACAKRYSGAQRAAGTTSCQPSSSGVVYALKSGLTHGAKPVVGYVYTTRIGSALYAVSAKITIPGAGTDKATWLIDNPNHPALVFSAESMAASFSLYPRIKGYDITNPVVRASQGCVK
jgi:hypothetical protein